MESKNNTITVYTDGSCNPAHEVGGWAALVRYDTTEITLQGSGTHTTHNRMELLAVIKALEYIESQDLARHAIIIYTDSQYVTGLPDRKEKLQKKQFITGKGNAVKNTDLIKQIIHFYETLDITFIKVKAHQKKSAAENCNRTVDKLSRKTVREQVKNRRAQ